MDYYLFQQIHNLAGRWIYLDSIGIFFAAYFQYILVGALLIFLFLGKDKEELKKNRLIVGLSLGAVILSRLVLTEIIRWLWFRPRPFAEYNFLPLIPHDLSASFPSGHAAFFFALAAVIFLFNKKAGWWFLAGSFLISLARIFVGVHYPSDILAGAIVGIFSGWLVVKIYDKIVRKKIHEQNQNQK